MSVMHHLDQSENVVARVHPFYATQWRVVRYEQSAEGKDQVWMLPYVRIRAIETVRPPNHRMMIGGTVVTLAGLFVSLTIGLYSTLLAVPVGIVLVVLGGGGRGMTPYFQLRAEGATAEELARWHIPFRGSMEFMAAVTQRTGQRPSE